jgi:hypothetical protein
MEWMRRKKERHVQQQQLAMRMDEAKKNERQRQHLQLVGWLDLGSAGLGFGQRMGSGGDNRQQSPAINGWASSKAQICSRPRPGQAC